MPFKFGGLRIIIPQPIYPPPCVLHLNICPVWTMSWPSFFAFSRRAVKKYVPQGKEGRVGSARLSHFCAAAMMLKIYRTDTGYDDGVCFTRAFAEYAGIRHRFRRCWCKLCFLSIRTRMKNDKRTPYVCHSVSEYFCLSVSVSRTL